MDKKHYDQIILQLRKDQQQIREEADKEIADLEQAIAVLSKRANEQPVAHKTQNVQQSLIPSPQPTEERIVVESLLRLGGRAAVLSLFSEIQSRGHRFNYGTSSQLHGFSIGLAKTRHTYERVGYDHNTREYYLRPPIAHANSA